MEHRLFVSGGHTDRLHPLDADVVVPAEGLGAEPGSAGPLERVRVEGLEPGWYRLRHGGEDGPTGRFEVRADTGPLPDLPEPELSLTVEPPGVGPAGGTVGITAMGQPQLPGSQEAAFQAARSSRVTVERWANGTWQDVGEVEALPERPPTTGRLHAQRVDLPSLEPGVHRLTQAVEGHQDRVGLLFVSELLAPAPPPPPLHGEPAEVVVALSAERIPVTGAAIGAVVVNRGDNIFAYGLDAEIERWDGTMWVRYRKVGDGQLRGLDEEVVVPSRVVVDGLAPDWYRYVVPGERDIIDAPF